MPQLLLSDDVSKHCPLHGEEPELHLNPQRPLSHVSLARATPDRHTSQLLPQEVGESALHVPLQSCIGAGHWHCPPMHVFPPLHALPHEPQFIASVLRSAHAPEHIMKPSVHSKLQRPPRHVGCACAIVVEHIVSHVPQCIVSFIVSAHVPPQSVGDVAGQPETHVPSEHIGVLASHATPHLPQFVGCVMSVSQPISGSSEQCAQPFAHDVVLTVQTSPLQRTGPATFGKRVQSCLQVPQLRLSLGTHAPSQDSWPEGQLDSLEPPAPEELPIGVPPLLPPALPLPLPLPAVLELEPPVPEAAPFLPEPPVPTPSELPPPVPAREPLVAAPPPSVVPVTESSVIPEAASVSSTATGMESTGVQLIATIETNKSVVLETRGIFAGTREDQASCVMSPGLTQYARRAS
jgi:hypothetical protein